MSVVELTGKVYNWNYGLESPRRYAQVALTFGQMKEITKSEHYNSRTGSGEQRVLNIPHVRSLRKAISEGDFTPTPIHIMLRPRHQKALKIIGENFSLKVKVDDPLPLGNGQHRMEALAQEEKHLLEKIAGGDLPSKDELEKLLSTEIPAIILFDGDPGRDFLNLQKGKRVDKTHTVSLELTHNANINKDIKVARELAQQLYQAKNSPFSKQIRFDANSKAVIPLATVLADKSGAGYSLVGLARVMAKHGFSTEQASALVVACFGKLQEDAADLLVPGMLLAPPPEGSKGGAIYLMSMCIPALHLMGVLRKDLPDDEIQNRFVDAARATMRVAAQGNGSLQARRNILREFTAELFSSQEELSVQGVPCSLFDCVPASTYGLVDPRKPRRGRPIKGAQVQTYVPAEDMTEEEDMEEEDSLSEEVVETA